MSGSFLLTETENYGRKGGIGQYGTQSKQIEQYDLCVVMAPQVFYRFWQIAGMFNFPDRTSGNNR